MGTNQRNPDQVISGMMSGASDPKIVAVVREICRSIGSVSLITEIEITIESSRIRQLLDAHYSRFLLNNMIWVKLQTHTHIHTLIRNPYIAFK